MKQIINGKNIVKIFGENKEKLYALNGINVSILEGEFIAIMGPSGSGKSTLMFVLSGMDEINEGTVCFCDKDLSKLKEQELADIRRKEMGFIFQMPTMINNLNILDNIILPTLKDNKNHKEVILKAKELMLKTEINNLKQRDITEVSGGELQRAGLCRALMSNPKIIFGDEPTGALNSKAADSIMDLLTKINQENTAIMLVTHDAKVAARADRVLIMKDGKIIEEIKFAKYNKNKIEGRTEKINKVMLKQAI